MSMIWQLLSREKIYPGATLPLQQVVLVDPALQTRLIVSACLIGKQILAHFRARSASSTGESWWLVLRDRLMQASPEFREWWSRHDIGVGEVSQKEINHPRVGSLVLQPTTLVLADEPNLKLFLYTPLAQADTAEKLA